ncbi:SdpA family antimicrobial peptide system protein [Leifsonia shinshuensis]|nr:SdpA family antimicrobial peptide system protein [Leifsonia shinshuensis]
MRVTTALREKVASAISATALVSIIALSAFLSADSTVLYPREQEGDPLRKHLLPLFPQSWPFFTKPPTDCEYAAYSVDGSSVAKATNFPNSLAKNGFGFARTQRAQGPELANLAMRVPPGAWTECVSVAGDCVAAASQDPGQSIENLSNFPSLCGSLVLAETEPVDWSFRTEYNGWRVDTRAVKVDIDCD